MGRSRNGDPLRGVELVREPDPIDDDMILSASERVQIRLDFAVYSTVYSGLQSIHRLDVDQIRSLAISSSAFLSMSQRYSIPSILQYTTVQYAASTYEITESPYHRGGLNELPSA